MTLRGAIVPVTPLQQNCSLLWCDETMKGAVVDPGGDLEQILAASKENGIELEIILVTHGHMDHAGGVAELAEKLSIPVEGPHKDDLFWIKDIEQAGRKYGVEGARTFAPDRWLEDGDTVSFGNITMSVHHCPGHTPGHVVFFDKESKLACVGDVLFKGSIGRTDFPKGNHSDLINAIKTQLWPLGDDVTFIPGHGPLSTFGEERASNPYVGDGVVG